jgi:hypothetical protein
MRGNAAYLLVLYAQLSTQILNENNKFSFGVLHE